MKFIRANYSHLGFQTLVKELDKELAIFDGDEHDFYHQFNGIDQLNHVIVVLENESAISCGAIKPISRTAMEIKRMYTLPENRQRGIARKVLTELEAWSAELGYEQCILETGKRQKAAVALYENCGYSSIEKYGQYKDMENSLCFSKQVKSSFMK